MGAGAGFVQDMQKQQRSNRYLAKKRSNFSDRSTRKPTPGGKNIYPTASETEMKEIRLKIASYQRKDRLRNLLALITSVLLMLGLFFFLL